MVNIHTQQHKQEEHVEEMTVTIKSENIHRNEGRYLTLIKHFTTR